MTRTSWANSLGPRSKVPERLFVDAGRIEYGEDFRNTIFAELSGCDELLVLLTPSSLKRPWVIAEIGAVLVQDKRVVAIRYGPSEGESPMDIDPSKIPVVPPPSSTA